MLLQILPIKMWKYGLLLIALLAVVFYVVLGLGSKSSITQQFLDREQTVARAEASNIQSFFSVLGESVAVLGRLSTIEERDSDTVDDMDTFVEQWRDSGLIGGVILTDKSGVVRFHSSVTGIVDIGESLADREYFVWAKGGAKEGDYYVGQPVVSRLGATKGQIIVPVVSPAFEGNAFMGVLTVSVKLIPLTQRYLELMKVTDTTDVYLVNGKKELIYSSSGEELPDLIKEGLDTSHEGSFRSGRYLVAYSPITANGQNWLLILSSPKESLSELTLPAYIRQTAALHV